MLNSLKIFTRKLILFAMLLPFKISGVGLIRSSGGGKLLKGILENWKSSFTLLIILKEPKDLRFQNQYAADSFMCMKITCSFCICQYLLINIYYVQIPWQTCSFRYSSRYLFLHIYFVTHIDSTDILKDYLKINLVYASKEGNSSEITFFFLSPEEYFSHFIYWYLIRHAEIFAMSKSFLRINSSISFSFNLPVNGFCHWYYQF